MNDIQIQEVNSSVDQTDDTQEVVSEIDQTDDTVEATDEQTDDAPEATSEVDQAPSPTLDEIKEKRRTSQEIYAKNQASISEQYTQCLEIQANLEKLVSQETELKQEIEVKRTELGEISDKIISEFTKIENLQSTLEEAIQANCEQAQEIMQINAQLADKVFAGSRS